MNLLRTNSAARTIVAAHPALPGAAANSTGTARTLLGRALLIALALAGLIITGVHVSGPAHAYQPCTNYRVTTNWGRVEVDTRPAGGDPTGNIAWAMFINDISHIPGRYDYQVLINGKSLFTDTIHKDNNLHITIPRFQNNRYVYESGDEIQVIASHAAGKVLYVTPINRCTVPYLAT
ncbi:hypothetical protein AB0H71_29715 [Nocardia sp. NPDC050697]|uniref:hypothetical protein n=1 Tax=Nocardia sp. NPDC050697 TaxID=3155158 RepID=UPI0033EE109D